jgi:SPP1 family predicted phage head-tail adaptor
VDEDAAMPAIGQLQHRVTFQRPAPARDEFGQPLPGAAGYVDVITVWAAIRPTGSNERLAAAQMQSGQTHVITTHYRADLAAATGAWRITMGARAFGITGLPRDIDERHQWLVLDATEIRHA